METCNRTMLTDEKLFVLTGPDGQGKFWGYRRLELEMFSKRVRDGCGVMVWARISWRGKMYLVFVVPTMYSETYAEMLEEVY